ncbi:MAG: hypothetical protein ABIT76_03805 [Chthoniobacterales bacterium]
MRLTGTWRLHQSRSISSANWRQGVVTGLECNIFATLANSGGYLAEKLLKQGDFTLRYMVRTSSTHLNTTPLSTDVARISLEKKSDRSAAKALKEAYRLHTSDKYTRQATRRYLR